MRFLPLLLLLVAACVSDAWPADMSLGVSLSAGSPFEIGGTLQEGSLRIAAAAKSCPATAAAPAFIPALAVELPWLSAGTFRCTGLLREVSDPLGFCASSTVWGEQTGFALDESPSKSDTWGVFFRPGAAGIGLFDALHASGMHQSGGILVLSGLPWLRLEGLWSISAPAPDAQPADWLLSAAPWPGGQLSDLAARLTLIGPGLSLVASAGGSEGKMVPPGMFWNLRGAASTPRAELDLRVGGVDSAYRAVEGNCLTDRFLVSTLLDLQEGRCRLSAGFDLAVGVESFSPSAALPTQEKLHALLERGFRVGRRGTVRCTLEIDKSIAWDESAEREESTQCRVEARAAVGPFDAAAELRCSSADGFGGTLTASLRPLPRISFAWKQASTVSARGGRPSRPWQPPGSARKGDRIRLRRGLRT